MGFNLYEFEARITRNNCVLINKLYVAVLKKLAAYKALALATPCEKKFRCRFYDAITLRW